MLRLLSMLSLLCVALPVLALPVGFRVNQGELVYKQLKQRDFRFLFDQRTEQEARFLLQTAIKTKPILDAWFGQKRDKPMLITSSAVTSNASFANFITDGIELQTLGRGNRDLLLHEYIHMMMFLYLDNFFGPAGAIVHLPWLPAWWIEGMAEALSVSVGSEVHYGIERHQALHDDFLSYEQLHSLYVTSHQYRGYSTAGRFFAFVLDHFRSPTILRDLHDEFYRQAMPWLWPMTIVPFVDWLPLDVVLKRHTGANGRELYQQYITAKQKYWQAHSPPVLLAAKQGKRLFFNSINSIQNYRDQLRTLLAHKDDIYAANIIFDNNTGLATTIQKTDSKLPAERAKLSATPNETLLASNRFSPRLGEPHVYVRRGRDLHSGLPNSALVLRTEEGERLLQQGEFRTYDTYLYDDKVVFLEYEFSHTRLCWYARQATQPDKHCPLTAEYPQSLKILGQQGDTIWLRHYHETIQGGRYKIITWHPKEGKREFAWPFISRPLRVVFAENKTYFFIAERRFRSIIELDDKWRCVQKIKFADHLTGLFSLQDKLVVSLYHPDGHVLVRPSANDIARSSSPCRVLSGHSSPLLYALQQQHIPSLPQALVQYESGENTQPTPPDLQTDITSNIKATAPDKGVRPLFIFPTLGAMDVQSLQFGVISVPLMDWLQNEMLVANLMYGLTSRYPAIDLTLTSNRFQPTLQASIFKRQLYDGADSKGHTIYYDEVGVRGTAVKTLYLRTTSLSLTLGIGSSRLQRFYYTGNETIPQGVLSHLALGLAWEGSSEQLAWRLRAWGMYHPAVLNREFNYHRHGLEASLNLALPFFNSELVSSVETIATTGPKHRNLQELYQVLQTWSPTQTGGINNVGIPLISGGGLFSYRLGDTQARTQMAWVVPLVEKFDRLFWIFYAEKLNFSAFCNYGGAWYRREGLRRKDLAFAHGYSIDLHLNNKGVQFHLGLGAGQVLSEPMEVYANFGFSSFL